MTHKVPAQCVVCKNGVTFDLAEPKIINSLYVSLMILEHPKQQLCPNCSTPLLPGIAAIQGLVMGTIQVPKEDRPLIVVPPVGGLKQ